MRVFGVILTYNCENLVQRSIDNIPEGYFDKIICSDDGSTDQTEKVIKKNNIEFYSHAHTGYGGNLFYGLKKAFDLGATHVVEIHGDGQYNLDMIEDIKLRFEKNSDLILGNRFHSFFSPLKHGMPIHIFIGNIFFSSLARIGLGLKHKDLFPGLRAYSKKFYSIVKDYNLSEGYQFSFEIIAISKLNNLNISSVKSICDYTQERKTAPLIYTIYCLINIFQTCLLYRLAKNNILLSIFKK